MGVNLLRVLVRRRYRIVLLLRKSSNTSEISNIASFKRYDVELTDLKAMLDTEKVDIILHCSTNYGRKDVNPVSILEANLILPLKLLQYGAERNVACFINTDTVLDKRVSQYSLSKSQFKEWLRLYSKTIKCINVALEHFYGPFDDETKFVTYIIHSIMRRVDHIDLTQGEQKRDFIYIDDVASAFDCIINHHCDDLHGVGFIHYDVGTGRTIKIRDFAALVKEIARNSRTQLNYGALPYRENEVMDSHVDIKELKKLGWKAVVSLEEGIKKTMAIEEASGLQ